MGKVRLKPDTTYAHVRVEFDYHQPEKCHAHWNNNALAFASRDVGDMCGARPCPVSGTCAATSSISLAGSHHRRHPPCVRGWSIDLRATDQGVSGPDRRLQPERAG